MEIIEATVNEIENEENENELRERLDKLCEKLEPAMGKVSKGLMYAKPIVGFTAELGMGYIVKNVLDAFAPENDTPFKKIARGVAGFYIVTAAKTYMRKGVDKDFNDLIKLTSKEGFDKFRALIRGEEIEEESEEE